MGSGVSRSKKTDAPSVDGTPAALEDNIKKPRRYSTIVERFATSGNLSSSPGGTLDSVNEDCGSSLDGAQDVTKWDEDHHFFQLHRGSRVEILIKHWERATVRNLNQKNHFIVVEWATTGGLERFDFDDLEAHHAIRLVKDDLSDAEHLEKITAA